MATQRIWVCEQEGEILACHFIKNPEALAASKSSSWSWNSRKTSRERTSRVASCI